MEYFVMKKAKESGVTVLLDGQGSDEILFGYEHNYQVLLSSLLRKLNFIEFLAMYCKIKTFRSSKQKVLVQSFLSIFTTIRAFRLYKKSYLKKEHRSFKEFRKNYKFLDILEYQINQVIKTNVPRYLKYQDKSSMNFSIESRVPFLDYRVVENSLMIDNELKFKDGFLKYPLRKIAEKLLPASIAWRTDKIGYEAPNRLWLKEIEAVMDNSIKESLILKYFININIAKLSLNQKWKLFTVSFWEKKYNVKL
jgi:asparagine synthase (glutamine-hydrolysing)